MFLIALFGKLIPAERNGLDPDRLLKRFGALSLSLSRSPISGVQSFLEGMIRRTALQASLIYLSSLLRRD